MHIYIFLFPFLVSSLRKNELVHFSLLSCGQLELSLYPLLFCITCMSHADLAGLSITLLNFKVCLLHCYIHPLAQPYPQNYLSDSQAPYILVHSDVPIF